MRVLFLTLYPESGASSRYRVLQYVPYLREHGVVCDVAPALCAGEYERLKARATKGSARAYHVRELQRRVWQIVTAGRYDIVFVQKAIMSAYVKRMCTLVKWRARRLVYDIDDAVNLAPPHALPSVWKMVEEPGQINKVMACADLVIAGNQWLSSVVEAAGGRAALLPTVVDTERFAPREAAPSEYRIGWMGNASTSSNLEAVSNVLTSLPDAEIRFVGADPARAKVSKAEAIPWSYEDEVRELQQMSVGIMPLPKTEWSRGKCALKAIQYMACGVPCVATPYGAVRDLIRHEENGLFADSEDEWRDGLERLRDTPFRTQLGKAARETIEKDYSLKSAAPKMLALLESVM